MLKIVNFVICLFLSSCMMVGPNYKEPKKPIAAHWAKKNNSVKETAFNNPKWWHVFHDPVLTALIEQGYQNNLSVQAAGVHVLQARAQLAQSVGQLYPQQQLMTGNFTYNRIGGSSFEQILPPTFDTALLGFSANWELDFWGKYRRAIQANDALFLESLAAFDHALVTLVSDIASTYIRIRTYEEQVKIINANIVVQKVGLKMALFLSSKIDLIWV